MYVQCASVCLCVCKLLFFSSFLGILSVIIEQYQRLYELSFSAIRNAESIWQCRPVCACYFCVYGQAKLFSLFWNVLVRSVRVLCLYSCLRSLSLCVYKDIMLVSMSRSFSLFVSCARVWSVVLSYTHSHFCCFALNRTSEYQHIYFRFDFQYF